MKNRNRFIYQPGLPLGKDGKRVTGGTEHIALSREAAAEGMVLLKNEKQVLPLAKGTKAAVFGKACVDYVKGGGGSGCCGKGRGGGKEERPNHQYLHQGQHRAARKLR